MSYPKATKPWQHVPDSLSGYIKLAELLFLKHSFDFGSNDYAPAINFGPSSSSTKPIEQLLEKIFVHWTGSWHLHERSSQPHEAKKLTLQIVKAGSLLNWQPLWSFKTTVQLTADWYKNFDQGIDGIDLYLSDIDYYTSFSKSIFSE